MEDYADATTHLFRHDMYPCGPTLLAFMGMFFFSLRRFVFGSHCRENGFGRNKE
jgi:hypothetical protein